MVGPDHPDFGGCCRLELSTHAATRPPVTHKPSAKWMSHVTIVEPWEKGVPAGVPHETERRPSVGGGLLGPFSFVFFTDYADDFILVRVEQEPSDQTRLIVSGSLTSDHVRRNPIFSPKNSTNRDPTVQALGHTTDTYFYEKFDHSRKSSSAQESCWRGNNRANGPKPALRRYGALQKNSRIFRLP